MSDTTVKLQFNHQWGFLLEAAGLSKEKRREFYEKFGYEYHSSTPKETIEEATKWIIDNMSTKNVQPQVD